MESGDEDEWADQEEPHRGLEPELFGRETKGEWVPPPSCRVHCRTTPRLRCDSDHETAVEVVEDRHREGVSEQSQFVSQQLTMLTSSEAAMARCTSAISTKPGKSRRPSTVPTC